MQYTQHSRKAHVGAQRGQETFMQDMWGNFCLQERVEATQIQASLDPCLSVWTISQTLYEERQTDKAREGPPEKDMEMQ